MCTDCFECQKCFEGMGPGQDCQDCFECQKCFEGQSDQSGCAACFECQRCFGCESGISGDRQDRRGPPGKRGFRPGRHPQQRGQQRGRQGHQRGGRREHNCLTEEKVKVVILDVLIAAGLMTTEDRKIIDLEG